MGPVSARTFREAGATTPKTAATLAQLGCRNSWIFRRLVSAGVFRPAGDDRFYIDLDAARRFVQRRRSRVLAVTAVLLLIFLIWLAVQ